MVVVAAVVVVQVIVVIIAVMMVFILKQHYDAHARTSARIRTHKTSVGYNGLRMIKIFSQKIYSFI